MNYIEKNPEVKVLFSKIEIYKDVFKPQNLLTTTPEYPYNPMSLVTPKRSADSQHKMLLLCDRVHYTPSAFLHRETLLSIGGFDERFKLLEDYPLWLKLTKSGHRLFFMDKTTVNYRRHSKAINNTGITHLVNPNYFRTEDFRKIYTYPYLPLDIRLSQIFTWYVSQVFRWNWLNKNKKPNRILLSLLTAYLNPFKYIIWIRKKIIRKLEENEFYN